MSNGDVDQTSVSKGNIEFGVAHRGFDRASVIVLVAAE